MKISSKDKQKLKSLAHSIKPSVIIGKEGISKNTLNSINNVFENKELIKIKFISFKDEKDSIAKDIEGFCNATLVGLIGNIIILFKQNPDIDKRKIVI
jgi:RNA-binding protein